MTIDAFLLQRSRLSAFVILVNKRLSVSLQLLVLSPGLANAGHSDPCRHCTAIFRPSVLEVEPSASPTTTRERDCARDPGVRLPGFGLHTTMLDLCVAEIGHEISFLYLYHVAKMLCRLI